jgi:hypothetical protein
VPLDVLSAPSGVLAQVCSPAVAAEAPQDPFAAIKDLYSAGPDSSKSQEPDSNINVLFQAAYTPAVMNATKLSAMDARQLVQLQAMVAESLQRQQMGVQATHQPTPVVNVPVATSGAVNLPPVPQQESSVFDVDLSSEPKRDPQFGDLLGAMEAKAVGWEKSNARCTGIVNLLDLL